MITLNSILSTATESLGAETAALSVTNNNIANANTPGYSRQLVTLSAQAVMQNGASVDAGVSFDGYTSVRDSVLQSAIDSTTSDQAALTAQSTSLQTLNTSFSNATAGIGAAMNTLFSGLSSLGTAPSDASARQSVLLDAGQLAGQFNQAASTLTSAGTSANQQVVSTVAAINQLAAQIATLNKEIGGGAEGGALADQRDSLTTQLAGMIGVSTIQNGTTPTLTTRTGVPLVIGDSAYPLQVATDASGNARVLDSEGNDITASTTGGTLGGALTTRDTVLPGLSTQLDSLASQFGAAMNAAQASGYDLNGQPGTAMFSTKAGSTGAAAGMQLALSSGSAIAISADGSANSSGNLANLLGVQNQPLPGGATPTDAYANFVQSVGEAGSSVSDSLAGKTAALQQLQQQQTNESGVSIDEETTKLIRYQQGYTAAARVISTVNDIYSVLMNISLGS